MKLLNYDHTKIYLDTYFTNLSSLLECFSEQNTYYLIDENVLRLHHSKFASIKNLIIIPSGENSKSLNFISQIVSNLLSLGANRKSYLIGIGGGVTTDITGFVASVFMRGISFGFIPTTLLAMCDASIGGKNGVNLNSVKNIVGVFNNPDFILIDYSFLKTLSNEELVNGFAEIIKHACIASEDLFDKLENISKKNLLKNIDDFIYSSILIKLDIVLIDKKEENQRKLLNFGHTFGHAIESIYGFSHGKSISLGMVFANQIATKMGYLDTNQNTRILNVLNSFNLPSDISSINKKEVLELIYNDKKAIKSNIDFIILNNIGEAFVKSLKVIELIDG